MSTQFYLAVSVMSLNLKQSNLSVRLMQTEPGSLETKASLKLCITGNTH